MKKLILLLISITLLYSCGNVKNNQGMIEESEEILNGYADTLESSVKDARMAKDLVNQNNDNLQKELNNIK